MENIMQQLQNIKTGIVIMGSAMAYSLIHMEYGMYIAAMIVLLGLFGIISWAKGRKTVSASVGCASLLAVLPAWFTSAGFGVALFVILALIFFLVIKKKKPDYGIENFLHALLLAGLFSSLVSLFRIWMAFWQMKYFSQMNVLNHSVYGLAPLLVFLLCFLGANYKERERLEHARLEARRAAIELTREAIKEQREKDELHLSRETIIAPSERIRLDEFGEEGTKDESDKMEQTMQEERVQMIGESLRDSNPMSLEELFNKGITDEVTGVSGDIVAEEGMTDSAATSIKRAEGDQLIGFTQELSLLFGENILKDMQENGAELAEESGAVNKIAVEAIADRIRAIDKMVAELEKVAEEASEEFKEGAESLQEIVEKVEDKMVAGNEIESWNELFRQDDEEEAIEEAALDALSEEDATDLPEAEEFAKTMIQEEGQNKRFGHEELENMLAEYQENEEEAIQEEEEPATIAKDTTQEPLAIGREDFCIKQEEYFREQYELIIRQAEIFRKQKEYHQLLLNESSAQFDFYTEQADLYLKQIDFYRKQRDHK